jgi:hypothetical protein
MAFSRGQPTWGAHLADELERLVALHDASTIAAVIVEPMQGSSAVVVPPVGYLEKLREICTKHGILLIFDEVITGFGRLGENFGAQRLSVTSARRFSRRSWAQVRRSTRSSSSTAIRIPATPWRPLAATPRSMCSSRRASSSAPASWSRCSKTRCTR